jgi:hypothetical protein
LSLRMDAPARTEMHGEFDEIHQEYFNHPEKYSKIKFRDLLINYIGETYFGFVPGSLSKALDGLDEKISREFQKLLLVKDETSRITYADLKFPRMVSLEGQFPLKSQLQIGGTCHIYSTTLAAESACYRKHGLRVDLSEAYLFYLHLRAKLNEMTSFDLDLQEDPGEITYFDAGDITDENRSYDRVLHGNILSEEELPFDDQYVGWYTNPIAKYRQTKKPNQSLPIRLYQRFFDRKNYENQTVVVNDRFPEIFRRILDERFYLRHGPTDWSEGLPKVTSKNPWLRKCFDGKMRLSVEGYSLKKALTLLSIGIPFTCSTKNAYGETGSDDYHSLNIIGYRYNPRSHLNIEFQTFDSNFGRPNWGWQLTECTDIHYVW